MAVKEIRLPPFCGEGLKDPLWYNPYQAALLDVRRQRICPKCQTIGPVNKFAEFICPACLNKELTQLTAKKAFHRIGIVGGRRSGKTRIGAHAAREEVIAPNSVGWVVGPTYKILQDSTMPALFRLIPPSWVKHWAPQSMDLTLINNHLIQIRSLDDPERGRGAGPRWIWMDEAQKISEHAWDVLRPSLTDWMGNCIFTFTPNGFDWTWRRLWKLAHGPFTGTDTAEPGFWMAKCKTTDNPWIQRFGMADVEEARRTMPPAMFRQEYEADFVSFVGNVYDWEEINPLILHEDGLKRFIPEWPAIDPSRQCVIGFSAKPGKPVGAALLVVTEFGVVVAKEYRDEHRAHAYHFDQVSNQFLAVRDGDRIASYNQASWAFDELETSIQVEATRRTPPLAIQPTDHYLITGVQRTHSWMYTKHLWFADTCVHTLDQMRGYRWADASADDPQAGHSGRVLERDDELPNAIRHGLLSWPSLPTAAERASGRDLSMMSERTRSEIQRMTDYEAAEAEGDDLKMSDPSWPLGDMYGGNQEG